jgi:MFS family permease
MLAPLDVPLLGPVLPRIAEAFAVSNARAGLVVTAFATPGVLAAPVLGWLADRYGRRRVLLPCLVVYGAAGVSVAAADDFLVVLALRAVQGLLGGSILSSLALTLAGDLFAGTRRNAAMGATAAAVTVSAAVAPAVGGALAGVAWNVPFLVYGLSLAVAVAVYVGLPEPIDVGEDGDDGVDADYLRAARDALPVRATLGVYAAAFLAYVLFFGAALTAVPFLLDDRYGLAPGRIGLLVTGASLVGAVVALGNGRLARYAHSTRLVALGLCGYGLGLVGVAVAGAPLEVGAGLVVFAAGHGLTQPSVAASLSSLAPTRFRGGVMSLRTSVILASQAVGPLLFTVSAGRTGYGPVLGGAGVATVCAGVAAVVLTRRPG